MKKLVILMALLLFLSGCKDRGSENRTFFSLDNNVEISIWGEEKLAAADAVKSLFSQIEERWSVNNINSIPSQMNGDGTVLYMDDIRFLDQVEALSQRTNGAFDPMLNSVISLWGFGTEDYQIPTREALDAALAEEKWNLSGLIRGYAGQRVVSLLQQMNVERAVVNIGGSVQTYGEPEKGEAWTVGIQSPNGGGCITTVSVRGTMAVMTSGANQQYFEKDGIKYHHILDPKTGMPVNNGLCSVTVISKDGMVADALSTALFVMGLDVATEFWRNSNDFEAVFVFDDGTIYATEGVELNTDDYTVIHREQ